jgi:hypothetical protein
VFFDPSGAIEEDMLYVIAHNHIWEGGSGLYIRAMGVPLCIILENMCTVSI